MAVAKKWRNWHRRSAVLDYASNMRVGISHINYGEIFYTSGTDTIHYSRLLIVGSPCGQVELTQQDGSRISFPLEENHVVFVPPNISMNYAFTPGTIIGIHFYLEAFPGLDLLEGEQPKNLPADSVGIDPAEVLKLLAGEETVGQSLRMTAEILKCVAHISTKDTDTIKHQLALKYKYKVLVNYIEEHLSASLTVEALADQMGLTRDQLSKRFRKDFGEPLKHYVSRMLTRRASRLLLSGCNVKSTASNLGFSSEFYFSRFFKKHMGMTPSDFLSNHH